MADMRAGENRRQLSRIRTERCMTLSLLNAMAEKRWVVFDPIMKPWRVRVWQTWRTFMLWRRVPNLDWT
jgi:hypothetical protein